MPQHEIGEATKGRPFDRRDPFREGTSMTASSPRADTQRPLLPAILYFSSLPPRQLYVGGFLVGFAVSAAIGAVLYLFLQGGPPPA
jgi:hypothetical protein